MNIFEGHEYIGLDRRENASVHGHPKVRMYPYSYAGRHVYHTICIPTHSMTHLNIAQSTPLDGFIEYFKPKIFENVAIVNCTEKQDVLNKHLMTIDIDQLFGEKSTYPLLDITKLNESEDTLFGILKDLEIDMKYIEKKFEKSDKELDDFSFIIFRTDWFTFRFNPNTLSNMHFEMFHAFLHNPYLTANTVRQLLINHESIQGIGSDTATLNNPISYVNPANAVPIVQKAYRTALNQGMFRNVE